MFRSALILFLVAATPAWGEEMDVDPGALLRFSATYDDTGAAVTLALGRITLDIDRGDSFAFEFNALAADFRSGGESPLTESIFGVERSSRLGRILSRKAGGVSMVEIDRLNLRLGFGPIDITVGRQGVNFATTFLFTPNDFFAPFDATQFYRLYKPGVDALRVEARLGSFSQATFLSVLGYGRDPGSANGYSDSPEDAHTSNLGRVSFVLNHVDIALLGGNVRGDAMIGAALQTEIPFSSGMAFRLAGHQISHDDREETVQIAGRIEKRFENGALMGVEGFWNGAGAETVGEYLFASGFYRARRYFALSGSYAFDPLLTGQALLLQNLDDNSRIWSLYFLYSLGDESEASLGLSAPEGATERGRSEYGSTPINATAEVRFFF